MLLAKLVKLYVHGVERLFTFTFHWISIIYFTFHWISVTHCYRLVRGGGGLQADRPTHTLCRQKKNPHIVRGPEGGGGFYYYTVEKIWGVEGIDLILPFFHALHRPHVTVDQNPRGFCFGGSC